MKSDGIKIASDENPVDTDATSDEFQEELAKQLAASMESLVRELSGETPAVGLSEEDSRKRQEAWEKMLIGELEGSPSSQTQTGSSSQKAHEDGFQASILQAMDKLKASDSTLHVCRFTRFNCYRLNF